MKKILIAEDDKFLASAYKAKLTKAGFDVAIVSSGDEVLPKLVSFTPDLIILDVIMPRKDGFAVLEDLKEARWDKLPILMASNLGQAEDVEKGLKLGANGYIIKSDLSLDDIIKKINALI